MAILADSNAVGARFVPASSGTYFGQAMTGGDIYTLSASGSGSITAQAIALSPQGNLAYSDDGVIGFVSIAKRDQDDDLERGFDNNSGRRHRLRR